MRTALQKLALVPYTFVLMNCAAVAAFYNFVCGRAEVWSPSVEPGPYAAPVSTGHEIGLEMVTEYRSLGGLKQVPNKLSDQTDTQ
jgi:hypothetical protein